MWSDLLSFFSNTENQFAVALLVALVAPLISIIWELLRKVWYVRHKLKKDKSDRSILRRNLGMPIFMGISIGLFIGLIAFYFPTRCYDPAMIDSSGFIKYFKVFLYSVHSSIRTFIIGINFTEVHSALATASHGLDQNGLIYQAYLLYAAVMCIFAPALTAVGLLSFFKDLLATLRLTLSPKRRVYYFSELNYRSISVAIDVLTTSRNIKKLEILKPLIVFFDVNESDNGAGAELLQQAKRLGAICFQKDVSEANLKDGPFSLIFPFERKFYFLSENEDKNVKQSITLMKICRSKRRMNNKQTQFYVFATTEDSELLLDAADKGSMKERRVNENRNLVLSTIRDKGIFTCETTDSSDVRHIDVLIVGGGSYGTELIKALCWCGQIPGYYMHIHVIDKEKNSEERFKAIAPELWEKRGGLEQDGPCYDISFYPDIDVYSNKFIETVNKIENINIAFITLGDDRLNVNASLILRRELLRRFEKLGNASDRKVNIYAVVYSNLKSDIVRSPDGAKSFKNDRCNIEFIGDLQTRYSLRVIEQTDLENDAIKVHCKWTNCTEEEFERRNERFKQFQNDPNKAEKNCNRDIKRIEKKNQRLERRLNKAKLKSKLKSESSLVNIQQEIEKNRLLAEEIRGVIAAWKSEDTPDFNQSEYHRRSSIASAVYKLVLKNLGIDIDSCEKDYEHIRWMAYMRAEGYIQGVRDENDKRDPAAKTHPAIDAKHRDK